MPAPKKLIGSSWAAHLTEDQMWSIYDRAKKAGWENAANWAAKEYALEKPPSRAAFFRWRAWMQTQEHAHRIGMAVVSQNQARQLAASYEITAEENVKQLMSLATSATLVTENVDLAGQLLEMALKISKCEQAKRWAEIEEKKIQIRQEELDILKRRLVLYEEREAKTREVIEEEQLTPEEREQRIKEILGIA